MNQIQDFILDTIESWIIQNIDNIQCNMVNRVMETVSQARANEVVENTDMEWDNRILALVNIVNGSIASFIELPQVIDSLDAGWIALGRFIAHLDACGYYREINLRGYILSAIDQHQIIDDDYYMSDWGVNDWGTNMINNDVYPITGSVANVGEKPEFPTGSI
jgi:hypothetical protein